MEFNLAIRGTHSPRESHILASAQALKERALSVKVDLSATNSDRVQLDKAGTNEGLGAYSFKGFIGVDGFSSADATINKGNLEAFAAHNPVATPGETIKFHLQTSQATGMRAGIASALGAVSGALGNAGAWFMAQAMTTESTIGSKAYEVASMPLIFGSNVAHAIERKVADPGTKDEYYAIAKANGDYEQYLFTADNRVEADIFLGAASKAKLSSNYSSALYDALGF
jgi:hypothetical protein